MRFISPLSYPGGKAKQFDKIRKYFPSGMKNFTFIDAMCGGTSVALNVLNLDFSKKVIINDINTELINFWKTVKCDRYKFIKEHLLCYVTKELKTQWKLNDLYNMSKQDVSALGYDENGQKYYQAVQFLIKNKLCFNSIPWGKFTMARYEQNLNYSILERIKYCNKLLNKNVEIMNLDVFELLDTYKNQENILWYFDPPYYKIKCLYKHSFNQWKGLFKQLSEIKGKFILSLNYHEDIIKYCKQYKFNVYKEHWKYSMTNNTGTSASIKKQTIEDSTELIITNFRNEVQNG